MGMTAFNIMMAVGMLFFTLRAFYLMGKGTATFLDDCVALLGTASLLFNVINVVMGW